MPNRHKAKIAIALPREKIAPDTKLCDGGAAGRTRMTVTASPKPHYGKFENGKQ